MMDHQQNGRIPVNCRGCERLLGHMTTGAGNQVSVVYFETLLDGFMARQGKIACPSCGQTLHYSQPRRSWRDLWGDYLAGVTNAN